MSLDRSDVITLVGMTEVLDENGVWQTEENRTNVFCSVDSVTRAEFFDAGRSGLNPEYRITMFFGDYDGQQIVEYKGKRYGVYRVYHDKNDSLELYVERKGGTNGKNNN